MKRRRMCGQRADDLRETKKMSGLESGVVDVNAKTKSHKPDGKGIVPEAGRVGIFCCIPRRSQSGPTARVSDLVLTLLEVRASMRGAQCA